MTPSEFIETIRTEVRDAAVSDVLHQLRTPSGRKPRERLKVLSAWFNGLTTEDQKALAEVASLVSHHAVFGFLAVLDGARSVEDLPEKGIFRLFYEKAGKSALLTSESLHELLNAE